MAIFERECLAKTLKAVPDDRQCSAQFSAKGKVCNVY